MYKENPQFKPPNDENAKIWRYMSFDRYKDILSSGSLYFCSGNKLKENDPYEGSYLSFELLKNISKKNAIEFANKMKSCGPHIKVNCWHLNEYESVAMWKIYGKAIALQSTFICLVKALEKCPCAVHIGQVFYIVSGEESFKTDGPVTVFVPWLHKHRSFDYERELRAIIWETEYMPVLGDGSVLAPVDLVTLIKAVYISPTVPSDVKVKVEEINRTYSVAVPVFQSELASVPAY
ncbi:MAG: hypothetical protein JW837_10390 [Sedimentisphaerales bacterium]|nr:hypothetical protein [Sedimentisphaerales bacterium]